MIRNSKTRHTKRSRMLVGESLPLTDSNLGNCRLRAPKRRRTQNVVGVPAATIGLQLPSESLQLKAPYYCHHCFVKLFASETKFFCCGDGDIEIAMNEYPPELAKLFMSDEEDAVHFRQYARLYNNLFAFSSLGGNYGASTEKGIYVFMLHGQLYHYVPDLLPGDGGARYLQLYFYDGQQEAKKRTDSFPEVRQDIIDILMRVSEANPYACFFRSLREIEVTEETQIILNQSAVVDQRMYNAPTTDEVTAIWPDSTSSSHRCSPHIFVTGRSSTPHCIYHHYGCYDPLQYPLLFPRGESGWSQGLKKKSWVVDNNQ